MNQDIYNKVKTVICETAGVDPNDVRPESDFLKDLNLDPSEKAEVLSRVFENYQITPELEESQNIASVLDLVDLVHDKLP